MILTKYVLITKLIENRKKFSKNTGKKFKKTTQSSKTDVSDFKMFLVRFC